MAKLCVFVRSACDSICILSGCQPITGCVIAQLPHQPCWALTHPVCLHIPSLTQSVSQDQCLAVAISTRPAVTAPLRQFKGHESLAFWSVVYKSTYNMIYPLLPHTSLFAALKKSDRDASQLAPSVPLLSYRRAAGCAVVGCTLQNQRLVVKLHDDFWWITAVIVHSSFPFLKPLLPSSFCIMTLLPSFPTFPFSFCPS